MAKCKSGPGFVSEGGKVKSPKKAGSKAPKKSGAKKTPKK